MLKSDEVTQMSAGMSVCKSAYIEAQENGGGGNAGGNTNAIEPNRWAAECANTRSVAGKRDRKDPGKVCVCNDFR